MRKKKRLLWQLFPSYLLITLIALVAVTLYATTTLRQFYYNQIADDLQSRAHLLERQVLQCIIPFDGPAIADLCKKAGNASATRITVVLPSGAVVGDSDEHPEKMDNHALRPEIVRAKQDKVGRSLRYSMTLEQKMMYIAVPLKNKNRIIAVIRTALPVTAIDNELRSIQEKIAFGGLFIALIAAGISLYVSRRISLPIEEMKKGAERFARGDLSHRLSPNDLEETDRLAEALNQMAAQLDDRMKTVIEQRNELEAVLSSMEEGVIAFDVDEHIISINQAAARIFEAAPADMLNRPIQETIRNPEIQRFIRTALQEPENLEKDITLYREEERIIHVHSTSLYDATGTGRGILVVLNDVTRLRKLDHMRRDFAANVSHELKTPLTAIKGFVETLLNNGKNNPEESKRFLDIIAKHTDRLTAIINDLMILSKIEQQNEKQEITFEITPIGQVVEKAVQACMETAKEKEITVHVQCKKDITARIDAVMIEQALINLLDNAVHYSNEKGIINISVGKENKEIVIHIKDHGIGISKEHLSRLFERFYRVDKARNRSLGGTGLGLAIVKHIIHAHNGRVSVESTPGKGSLFTLFLPTNTVAE